MRNIKRAYLGVTKRFKKTILILLLISIVVTMIMIGLGIKKTVSQANQSAKDQMRAETVICWDLDSLDSVGREKVPYLTKEVLEQVKKVDGVTDASVKVRSFVRTDLKQIGKPGVSVLFNQLEMPPTNNLYGLDKKEDDDNFLTNKYKLISGILPKESSENNPILISKEYAEKNNLKIGDTIDSLGGEMKGLTKIKLTVCGIFDTGHVKETQAIEFDNTSHPGNNFYTTNELAESLGSSDSDGEPRTYQQMKVSVDKVDNLSNVINKIKKEVSLDWNYFQFQSDYEQYERVTTAINNMSGISNVILWISGIAGVLILSLVMILSFRSRKFEMGVLLSIGEKKTGLVFQMLIEALIIFSCSFILATGISAVSANKIGDALMATQVTNVKNDKIEDENENLKKDGFDKYERRKIKSIEKVGVRVLDKEILLKTGTLGLTIVLIATMLPLSLILRKDPKTIMLEK
ncbi:hypothetical protein DOK67_0000858 [Enterococcus sp. DIV0212c]|uniref:ABC transporter permease n=1 Tax=Enterococcus sp. DIV0212c TaxID=2230867 RepID=UPI001A9B0091|nr:ABC transporter permease [Enterococcus sp. DIV0212c]MBO1353737.1 ABC transporter permease [Enterococcus sp. DIV0212c]